MYVEELITWIAVWMDFWTWLDFPWARPGGSRPAWPSTIFPTSFDMDFPMHFGMDLASILEQTWNIYTPFWHLKIHHRFCLVFHWFSMQTSDPSTMENSILTWYSRKNQRNRKFRFYMNCVSNLAHILASFSYQFWMILPIFWKSIFGCIFGCVFPRFRHQDGSQMAPEIESKSQEKSKMCSPVQLMRSGSHFDLILDAFWSPFGQFWGPFGSHLL